MRWCERVKIKKSKMQEIVVFTFFIVVMIDFFVIKSCENKRKYNTRNNILCFYCCNIIFFRI